MARDYTITQQGYSRTFTVTTGGGGGAGDMLASTYDPTGVEGDAFTMDNMVEGADSKILTAAERAAIAANTSHTSDTTNPHSVTAAQVGLGNVDNTADADKPISTATQAGLDGKQDILTVSDTAPASPDAGDLWLDSTQAKLYTYYNDGDSSQWVSVNSGTATPTAASIGLGSVDNTADADKPISTATQTALDGKQDILAEGAFVDGDKQRLAAMSILTGDNSIDADGYYIIAGVLRNSGSGWDVIDDWDEPSGTGHRFLNIASITNSSTGITINYANTSTGVVSFLVTPDETLAEFFQTGASVGISSSTVAIRCHASVGGYVSYNGSGWSVLSTSVGIKSAAWSTDKLVITFDDWVPAALASQVTHRGGNYIAQIDSSGNSSVDVRFYDFDGNLVTTQSSDMKVRILNPGMGHIVNPNDINTTSFPSGNIWVLGLVRK